MMNKEALVKAVALQTGATQVATKPFVDAVQDIITDAIKRGEGVKLQNFVTFSSKEVAEGKGRNPQNGAEVVVPAHRKNMVHLAKGLRKS